MKKLVVAMLLVGGVCGSVNLMGGIHEDPYTGEIYRSGMPSPEGYSRYPVAGEVQDTSTLPLQTIAFQLKTLIKNFPENVKSNLNSNEQLFLKNSLKNLNNMFPEKTVLGRDPRTWGPINEVPVQYYSGRQMMPHNYGELKAMEAAASQASKKVSHRRR